MDKYLGLNLVVSSEQFIFIFYLCILQNGSRAPGRPKLVVRNNPNKTSQTCIVRQREEGGHMKRIPDFGKCICSGHYKIGCELKDQSSHCWKLDLCRMSRNSEASYESRGRAVFWINTDAVSITLQCCSARPCCMGGGKMCRLLQYLINILSLGHSAHCRRTADWPLHYAAACTDPVTSS